MAEDQWVTLPGLFVVQRDPVDRQRRHRASSWPENSWAQSREACKVRDIVAWPVAWPSSRTDCVRAAGGPNLARQSTVPYTLGELRLALCWFRYRLSVFPLRGGGGQCRAARTVAVGGRRCPWPLPPSLSPSASSAGRSFSSCRRPI